MKGKMFLMLPIMKGREFSQVSPVFLIMNQIMWRSFLSNHSLLRWWRRRRRRGRSKKKEETVSSPKHVSPIIVVPNEYESKIIEDDPLDCIHYYLDVKSIGTIEEDYVMPVTYCNDHDWENNTTYDLENLFGTNFENDGL